MNVKHSLRHMPKILSQFFKFRTLIIITFSAILRVNYDKPVVSSRGNRSTQQKTLAKPKSLAAFSHALAGIRKTASSQWQRHRPLTHQGTQVLNFSWNSKKKYDIKVRSDGILLVLSKMSKAHLRRRAGMAIKLIMIPHNICIYRQLFPWPDRAVQRCLLFS